jgi:hypothetical protein
MIFDASFFEDMTRSMLALYSRGFARCLRLSRTGGLEFGAFFSGVDMACLAVCDQGIASRSDAPLLFWEQNSDFEICLGPARQIDSITTLAPAESGFGRTWVSCCGRRTTSVSTAGDLHLASANFCPSESMGELKLDCPGVICATGPMKSYAIHLPGRAVRFATRPPFSSRSQARPWGMLAVGLRLLRARAGSAKAAAA